MTPDYLNKLADLADPDQLWRIPGDLQLDLPPDQRHELDTGVALRRYAAHIRDLNALLGTGKSLLITPLSENGSAKMTVPAPPNHAKLIKVNTP